MSADTNSNADLSASSPAQVQRHSTLSPFPVWLSESTIDPQWISIHTALQCTACSVQDVSNDTRKGERIRDGATLLLTLANDKSVDDEKSSSATATTTLILKQVGDKSLALSQQLGLAREALAYQYLQHLPTSSTNHQIKTNDIATEAPSTEATSSSGCCPRVYYAYGDLTTGHKVILMEHLHHAIDSAVFFGPGSPHNWKKDLQAITSQLSTKISAQYITHMTFTAMAHIHAQNWKNQQLLDTDKTWLRGQQWLQGMDRESWEASQALIQQSWKKVNSESSDTIVWDELLRACVDKAVTGISWESQLQRLHPYGEWTLVHGDFWPGNVMYLPDDDQIKLLDWEMCGIGSGPQDLGQYILSNMEPSTRQLHERELIQSYHNELIQHGVSVSFEYVWKEYTVGGMERWMWFLVYFLGLDGFTDWAQFFHNQMASFLHYHNLKPDDFTQVRP